MSVWKDEADFMKDIESISEFFISGNHNYPDNKFVFKSKQENKAPNTPWYESDSEEETSYYSFGRGRKVGDISRNPGPEPDHLDVMREIQMQVRNAVGNRYNNDVLESYYNVCKDDDSELTSETPSCAPKEVSISYAKEQNRLKNSQQEPLSTHPQTKKNSIADNIHNAVAKLTKEASNCAVSVVASASSSASSSPKKENRFHGGHSKKRYAGRGYKNNPGQSNQNKRFPFTTPRTDIDVNSKFDFPPL